MNDVAVRPMDSGVDRRTLAGVLAGLAMAIVPDAVFIPPWLLAFCLGIAAWRLAAPSGRWRTPGRLVRGGLATLAVLAVVLEFRTLNGIEAGTTLLAAMTALKLLEVRTARHCQGLIVLGLFLVAAGLLYNQGLLVSIWMVLATWFLLSRLLVLAHPESASGVKASLALSGRHLLTAVPVLVVLFVLFPRIPGPLWGLPEPGADAVTGLSDRMHPGSITSLAESDEVAFRVEFEDQVPPDRRYWRGPVLHEFDGQVWRRGWDAPPGGRIEARGGSVEYRVMLEPHSRRWLFALSMPSRLPDDAALTQDYQLRAREPVRERRRYAVRSHTDFAIGKNASKRLLAFERRLPDDYNPRTRELAEQWRAETADDAAIVRKALDRFRNQPFVYTMQPPALGRHSMDEFLFETRRGFCEHYASAFTVLMRAAGIPARVVLGYQGAEPNPLADYYIVRQSNAHAWSEVWLEGRGWVRVDPTAAVAPGRVERGLEASLSASERDARRGWFDAPVFERAGLFWDSVRTNWDRWFLAYGPELQRGLLSRLGMDDPDTGEMVGWMVGLIAGLMALLTAWLWWRQQPPAPSPERRLWQRFEHKLARETGIRRAPGEPESQLVARCETEAPELAVRARRVLAAYHYLRYLPGGRRDGLERLRQLVRDFPGPGRAPQTSSRRRA